MELVMGFFGGDNMILSCWFVGVSVEKVLIMVVICGEVLGDIWGVGGCIIEDNMVWVIIKLGNVFFDFV